MNRYEVRYSKPKNTVNYIPPLKILYIFKVGESNKCTQQNKILNAHIKCCPRMREKTNEKKLVVNMSMTTEIDVR